MFFTVGGATSPSQRHNRATSPALCHMEIYKQIRAAYRLRLFKNSRYVIRGIANSQALSAKPSLVLERDLYHRGIGTWVGCELPWTQRKFKSLAFGKTKHKQAKCKLIYQACIVNWYGTGATTFSETSIHFTDQLWAYKIKENFVIMTIRFCQNIIHDVEIHPLSLWFWKGFNLPSPTCAHHHCICYFHKSYSLCFVSGMIALSLPLNTHLHRPVP